MPKGASPGTLAIPGHSSRTHFVLPAATTLMTLFTPDNRPVEYRLMPHRTHRSLRLRQRSLPRGRLAAVGPKRLISFWYSEARPMWWSAQVEPARRKTGIVGMDMLQTTTESRAQRARDTSDAERVQEWLSEF